MYCLVFSHVFQFLFETYVGRTVIEHLFWEIAQAAVEEGIVVGGGSTLLRLAAKVDAIKATLENDEQKVCVCLLSVDSVSINEVEITRSCFFFRTDLMSFLNRSVPILWNALWAILWSLSPRMQELTEASWWRRWDFKNCAVSCYKVRSICWRWRFCSVVLNARTWNV